MESENMRNHTNRRLARNWFIKETKKKTKTVIPNKILQVVNIDVFFISKFLFCSHFIFHYYSCKI